MNLFLILILTWFQGNQWDKANRQVVRLAASSFKQLPKELTQELERRGCTVPQVWGSRQPGNVIRGEFLPIIHIWASPSYTSQEPVVSYK